jgi:hypothetical protein
VAWSQPAAVTGGDDPARPLNGMDALIRPEGLRITASQAGNGIVTTRTFLGQLTRISVRLSGDVVVQVDERTSEAAEISLGLRQGQPARCAGAASRAERSRPGRGHPARPRRGQLTMASWQMAG